MGNREFIAWKAFFELKYEEEQEAIDQAKRG
jgi:hypothetical protein